MSKSQDSEMKAAYENSLIYNAIHFSESSHAHYTLLWVQTSCMDPWLHLYKILNWTESDTRVEQ